MVLYVVVFMYRNKQYLLIFLANETTLSQVQIASYVIGGIVRLVGKTYAYLLHFLLFTFLLKLQMKNQVNR
jgi:hypothetical protein